MSKSSLEHRQLHNLLLISKLLNQRESASPFTLILDTLEQSARPLITDCIRRARRASTKVVFVSVDTLRKPPGTDIFIPIWQYGFQQFQSKLSAAIEQLGSNGKCLIIIDSLNALCSGDTASANLPSLLSSFLRPTVSLLATCHTDIPWPAPAMANAYQPQPLTLLRYLATTIITVHSFHHLLAQKKARERSLAEPAFGLDQGLGGVLVGEGAQGLDGLVLEMEFRRKSGRGVQEWFFMSRSSSLLSQLKAGVKAAQKAVGLDNVILLEDHPLWMADDGDAQGGDDETHDVSFSIGLTDRQRQDREGVVLPYFDAQKGGGEGGRILYDMGVEDDFDDEEDEI